MSPLRNNTFTRTLLLESFFSSYDRQLLRFPFNGHAAGSNRQIFHLVMDLGAEIKYEKRDRAKLDEDFVQYLKNGRRPEVESENAELGVPPMDMVVCAVPYQGGDSYGMAGVSLFFKLNEMGCQGLRMKRAVVRTRLIKLLVRVTKPCDIRHMTV